MSDKVPSRKAFKLGFATIGMTFAMVSGALLSATGASANGTGSGEIERGRQLFQDWSCGTCHVLKDAGGQGHIGPALDGNEMTKAYVVGRITGGQGAMPGFGGMLTDEEIDDLALYIVENGKK